MKRWIHLLASMKIAVSLILIIGFAMAAGTIVESVNGTEAATRAVYGTVWFRLLLGLFAASVCLSLIDAWPWGGPRIGFVLTHGSMLLILVGAAVTDSFKIEGHLALWEGDESAQFEGAGGPRAGGTPVILTLPFKVRLEAFEIDYYQGTDRPAMYRSRVVVNDTSRNTTFAAIIEMNRELSYRGYRLFQSSYQQVEGREGTVLSVSKDPGQPIVFVGYVLLMAGMLTVLCTRIVQRRTAMRLAFQPAAKAAALLVLVAGLLLAPTSGGARAAVPGAGAGHSLDPAALELLRRLPVQHDGRIMPLDTLAREAVWQVTGKPTGGREDAVERVLSWAFDPDRSMQEPIVPVGGLLASAAGTGRAGAGAGGRASFDELVRNRMLIEFMGQARAANEAGKPLNLIQKQAQKLEERLVWIQGFRDGSLLRFVPGSDPRARWSVPDRLASITDLVGFARSGGAAGTIAPSAIEREIVYNRIRPSRLAWWLLLLATTICLLGGILRFRWLDLLAGAGLTAGVCVMTWGLAARWQIAGRIPASNMYESLLFLGWGAALFALIAAIAFRNRLVLLNAAAMSALTMCLADRLPLDPFVHPVPPVLAGTAWLAIHVPIIMVSYSVLTLGVFIAHMRIGVEIFAPARQGISARLNELLYWYIHIGSILLIAGILTGSIWAASSWGRYWGWDPKEVWSLVAFLAYLAILHGRLDHIVGSFGVAAMSIVAFWMILMTYVGVNFVLTAGLHSYGFGGSGVVLWFGVVALIEALFLTAGALAHAASGRRMQARAA